MAILTQGSQVRVANDNATQSNPVAYSAIPFSQSRVANDNAYLPNPLASQAGQALPSKGEGTRVEIRAILEQVVTLRSPALTLRVAEIIRGALQLGTLPLLIQVAQSNLSIPAAERFERISAAFETLHQILETLPASERASLLDSLKAQGEEIKLPTMEQFVLWAATKTERARAERAFVRDESRFDGTPATNNLVVVRDVSIPSQSTSAQPNVSFIKFAPYRNVVALLPEGSRNEASAFLARVTSKAPVEVAEMKLFVTTHLLAIKNPEQKEAAIAQVLRGIYAGGEGRTNMRRLSLVVLEQLAQSKESTPKMFEKLMPSLIALARSGFRDLRVAVDAIKIAVDIGNQNKKRDETELMMLLEELGLLPVLRKLFGTKNSRMILEGLGLLLKTWAGLPETAKGEFEAKVNEVLDKAKKMVPAAVGRTESVHTEIVMKAFELLVTEGLNIESEYIGGKLAGYLRVVMHRLQADQFDSFRRAA